MVVVELGRPLLCKHERLRIGNGEAVVYNDCCDFVRFGVRVQLDEFLCGLDDRGYGFSIVWNAQMGFCRVLVGYTVGIEAYAGGMDNRRNWCMKKEEDA